MIRAGSEASLTCSRDKVPNDASHPQFWTHSCGKREFRVGAGRVRLMRQCARPLCLPREARHDPLHQTMTSRFVAIVRSRWRLAAAVLVGVTLLGLLADRLLPPLYTAVAEVLVDVAMHDRSTLGTDAGTATTSFMATQVDIVTSQTVALAVVDRLDMHRSDDAVARWRDASGGVGSIRHFHADRLFRNLDVRSSRGSGLLSIRYSDRDPSAAARIANAFALTYVDTIAQLNEKSTRASQQTAEVRYVHANAVLLNRAVEPATSSRPSIGLVVALASFAGALLAIGSVLVAESRRRFVRGPEDLRASIGEAVVGTIRDHDAAPDPTSRARMREQSSASARAVRTGWGSPERSVETRSFAPAMASSGGRGPAAGSAEVAVSEMVTVPHATAALRVPADPTARKRPLGAIMVEAGILQEPAVERILAWAKQEGLRFGEAAVQSHLATEDQVRKALAFQFDHAVLDTEGSGVSRELVSAFESRHPVVADLRRLRSQIHARQSEARSVPGRIPLQVVAIVGLGEGEGRTFVAANLAVTFSQMGHKTLLIDADLANGRIHSLFGFDNRTGFSAMLNGRIGPGALRRVAGLRDLTVITSGARAPNPTDLLSRTSLEHLLSSFRRLYDIVIVDTPAAADAPDAELVARRAGACIVVARRDHAECAPLAKFTEDLRSAQVMVVGSVLMSH